MFPRLSPDYRFTDVLRALWPADQVAVQRLEAVFEKRTRHKHAIAFRYGRSGLYYLLKALDTSSDRRLVIMPSYSCVVVANAIIMAGYVPVFIDNTPNRFQPDAKTYIDQIERHKGQVAMIIPTHLFGMTEETRFLYQTIKKTDPDIFILQDCAHGFFCVDDNNECTTHYGDGAIFGMNISKLANTVKGGVLTIREASLAQKIKKIHQEDLTNSAGFYQSILARLYVICAYFAFKPIFYGVVNWLQNNTKLLSSQTDYYKEDSITLPTDYAGEMCAFEATIGLSSMDRYDTRIANRRTLANRYTQILSQVPYNQFLSASDTKDGYSWSHYPVLCSTRDVKNHIIKALGDYGFEIGEIVDYSIADMACYQALGHKPTPNAQKCADLVVNFPLTLGENIDIAIQSKLISNQKKFETALRQVIESYHA